MVTRSVWVGIALVFILSAGAPVSAQGFNYVTCDGTVGNCPIFPIDTFPLIRPRTRADLPESPRRPGESNPRYLLVVFGKLQGDLDACTQVGLDSRIAPLGVPLPRLLSNRSGSLSASGNRNASPAAAKPAHRACREV